jgi:hypothetical protein
MERVFDKFPKYHTKILLRDFNAKVGRDSIFKPTIVNESIHEISNGIGVKSNKFCPIKKPDCQKYSVPTSQHS